MNANISLREVTADNWVQVICLEITREQEDYVALNSESIAASKFHQHYVNRAIYLDEEPVGFLQYYPNLRNGRPDEIFIDQLMVDASRQGQGIGTRAVALALDEIRRRDDCGAISVCYVEGHDIMRPFFERFGFRVVEQDEFDETIMRLELER
ncbi:GNAT family N-acetyltransferase [Lysobacter sp. BMK333-48F3]|uniref:GNAT family N-acetyltransferase n=1 Tax=Lysobacter sp. BMK333-48F3 TaxID=2867962 RepID=UPI001C8B645B|nr:GNAT family N-acetyltransferase [Lysobacter sp. BMK333-48F3]MBX9403002.1 GNAT family N-acetyltransferase [Lysobacter sp. BMK333-48F3]